eukprot:4524838-Prymnesium_polylepis.1
MAAVLRKVGMDPDKVVAELDSGEQIKALTLASGLKDPVSCRAVVGGRRELEGHGHSCVILYVLLTLFPLDPCVPDGCGKRFNDAGLPEGCVVDMLRGRGVAANGCQIESLQTLLESSVVVRVEGEGDDVREVERLSRWSRHARRTSATPGRSRCAIARLPTCAVARMPTWGGTAGAVCTTSDPRPQVLMRCFVADPTHFRNFLNNLKMTRGRRSAFVELQ